MTIRPVIAEREVPLAGLPGQRFRIAVETTRGGWLIARLVVEVTRAPDAAQLETASFEVPLRSLPAIAEAITDIAAEVGEQGRAA